MNRREISLPGTVEIRFTVDPEEFIGMGHGEIVKQLSDIASEHVRLSLVEVPDEELEVAAYQIRADLMAE